MPAASSVLETPSTTTQRFCIYRLYQLLKQGGWTVWGSGNASTFSTAGTDLWSGSYGASASINGAWIALLSPRDPTRGITLAFNPSTGNFTCRYTITGFSTSGVDKETPPAPVSTGGYIRNDVNYGLCYAGASQTVGTLNIVVQDDGSFSYETYDGGTRTALIQYSTVYAATTNVTDPNVWYDRVVDGGGTLNYFDGAGAFWAFGTDGVFQRFTAGFMVNINNVVLGNTCSNAWHSPQRAYVSSFVVYQSALSPYSILGVPQWIKFCGTTASDNVTHGNKTWIKRVNNSNALLPWDGVTTSGTDVPAEPDFQIVDPTLVGSGEVDTPEVSMSLAGVEPYDPRANLAITYDYEDGTDALTLTLVVYGDDGQSELVYSGLADSPTNALPMPTDDFEVVSSDPGELVLRPVEGKHWPLSVCTWVATIATADDTCAAATISQTIDTRSLVAEQVAQAARALVGKRGLAATGVTRPRLPPDLAAPVFTTSAPSLAGLTEGDLFPAYAPKASGYPLPSISVSGLPLWLAFENGQFFPTAIPPGAAGAISIQITATNGVGTATQTLSTTIGA